jgi:polar amino acid transport system permease protein
MKPGRSERSGRVSGEMTARAKSRYRSLGDISGFLVLLLGMVFFLVYHTEELGYHWQWYRIPKYFLWSRDGTLVAGPLIQGLLVTCRITLVSFVLAFAVGLLTALLRLSRSFVGSALARVYLEVVRNTPLLVQIFFVYFVLGPILGIPRFYAAVLALSFFEGAYASEIIRAGIISIPGEQWDAAYSLGLTKFGAYRKVILPQAIRWVLPPLTSQAISLVKDSALVSTIAVYDLTMRGQEIISETYLVFEVWFTVAAIYLALALLLSAVINVMEHRLRIPG